jgi:hypothetical protein
MRPLSFPKQNRGNLHLRSGGGARCRNRSGVVELLGRDPDRLLLLVVVRESRDWSDQIMLPPQNPVLA